MEQMHRSMQKPTLRSLNGLRNMAVPINVLRAPHPMTELLSHHGLLRSTMEYLLVYGKIQRSKVPQTAPYVIPQPMTVFMRMTLLGSQNER